MASIFLDRGLWTRQSEISGNLDIAGRPAAPAEFALAAPLADSGQHAAADAPSDGAEAKVDPKLLRCIDWGTQIADAAEIKVYFAPAGQKLEGVKSLGWNAYEIQQAMDVFQQYENIINIDVVTTANAAEADFKLATSDKMGTSILGYCHPPGEPGAGIGIFNRIGAGWDEAGGGGLEQGGYAYITLLHEFGHGFGLAHPHDNGGTSLVMKGVTSPFGDYGDYDLNQGVFTTMSYNDGYQSLTGSNPSLAYGYQGTMMALDIAVLQQKYGARADFHSGNDTYELDGANAPGGMYSCLWDTGGKDAIVYGGALDAVIDLRAATLDYSPTGGGPVSYAAGIFGGYTIAYGVDIENASGGKGDDILIGNKAKNAISGGKGDDLLGGGAGKDLLTGGDGHNVFWFYEYESKTKSIDTVKDLDEADDVIDVSYLDANMDLAGHQTFTFAPSGGFTGLGQIRLVLDSPDVVRVMLNVTGDLQSDMEMVLQGYGGGGTIFFDLDIADSPTARGGVVGYELEI